MKKLIAVISLSAALTVGAQTNTPPESIWTGLENIAKSIGSDMPTNIAVIPYGVWSAKTHDMGGGMFLLWDVTQNVGMGMGMELIGKDWFSPSADVTLKTQIHPLAFLGLTNVVATPYLMAGATTPLGGTQASSLGALAGGGLSVDFAHVFGGTVSVVGGDNYWSGSSTQDGNHVYGGLAWRRGF